MDDAKSVRKPGQRVATASAWMNTSNPCARWSSASKLLCSRRSAGSTRANSRSTGLRPAFPKTHAEHVRLMLDIFVLGVLDATPRASAPSCSATRRAAVDYSFLPGVKGWFHSLSHHGDMPDARDQYEKIVNWNIEQMAYFLNRMKGLDEGGTSLLDNSMIMFGGSLKDGNPPPGGESSAAAGGPRQRHAAHRDAVCARLRKTPLCNLYVSLLNRMGVEEKSFGDSTGRSGRPRVGDVRVSIRCALVPGLAAAGSALAASPRLPGASRSSRNPSVRCWSRTAARVTIPRKPGIRPIFSRPRPPRIWKPIAALWRNVAAQLRNRTMPPVASKLTEDGPSARGYLDRQRASADRLQWRAITPARRPPPPEPPRIPQHRSRSARHRFRRDR